MATEDSPVLFFTDVPFPLRLTSPDPNARYISQILLEAGFSPSLSASTGERD